MTSGDLVVTREGPVLTVVFNRPAQRNALTWEMYDALLFACDLADRDEQIRVMVLRGAGDRAFVAGTDIRQLTSFRDGADAGADGVAYEHRVSSVLARLEDVGVPTVAVIRGACVGAGLLVATVCDLRIAARSAVFGAPIARTVGNCLSLDSTALLVHHLGSARVLDLLLRGRLMPASEAYSAGFIGEPTEEDALDPAVAAVIDDLLAGAPLTHWATKEAFRRLRRATQPPGDDIVARVYGSADFREGVRAFAARETARWTGS